VRVKRGNIPTRCSSKKQKCLSLLSCLSRSSTVILYLTSPFPSIIPNRGPLSSVTPVPARDNLIPIHLGPTAWYIIKLYSSMKNKMQRYTIVFITIIIYT